MFPCILSLWYLFLRHVGSCAVLIVICLLCLIVSFTTLVLFPLNSFSSSFFTRFHYSDLSTYYLCVYTPGLPCLFSVFSPALVFICNWVCFVSWDSVLVFLLVCVSVSPAVLDEFPALFHMLQTDKNKREGIYTYEPPYEVHLLNSSLMQMSNRPVAW